MTAVAHLPYPLDTPGVTLPQCLWWLAASCALNCKGLAASRTKEVNGVLNSQGATNQGHALRVTPSQTQQLEIHPAYRRSPAQPSGPLARAPGGL